MKSEPDCRNIHVQTSFFNLQLEEKGAPVQISEEKYMHRATEIDFAWQSEAEISRCVWRRSGPPPPRRTEQRWPSLTPEQKRHYGSQWNRHWKFACGNGRARRRWRDLAGYHKSIRLTRIQFLLATSII
jgi:hypothetical protein